MSCAVLIARINVIFCCYGYFCYVVKLNHVFVVRVNSVLCTRFVIYVYAKVSASFAVCANL